MSRKVKHIHAKPWEYVKVHRNRKKSNGDGGFFPIIAFFVLICVVIYYLKWIIAFALLGGVLYVIVHFRKLIYKEICMGYSMLCRLFSSKQNQ